MITQRNECQDRGKSSAHLDCHQDCHENHKGLAPIHLLAMHSLYDHQAGDHEVAPTLDEQRGDEVETGAQTLRAPADHVMQKKGDHNYRHRRGQSGRHRRDQGEDHVDRQGYGACGVPLVSEEERHTDRTPFHMRFWPYWECIVRRCLLTSRTLGFRMLLDTRRGMGFSAIRPVGFVSSAENRRQMHAQGDRRRHIAPESQRPGIPEKLERGGGHDSTSLSY